MKPGAILILLFSINARAEGQKVIYGADDRRDLYQVDLATRTLADSTAVLVNSNDVIALDATNSQLNTLPYGERNALCSSEPFYSQGTVGVCSGFLVAPDKMLTAGHCVATSADCARVRFVFGFAMTDASISTWNIANSEIYKCAEIIHTVVDNSAEDFALIQLDRPVLHHAPLAYRESGAPRPSDAVMVIGYPAGLPVKIAAGANIRSVSNSYLTANLDTFGGNSGSAVFNVGSGEVEGVLVRGDTDYVYENGCYHANHCDNNGCRGEDATLMSKILPYLTQ